MKNYSVINSVIKKASKSPSTVRMAGIAFNKKGEILGLASNGYRHDSLKPGKFSGQHVEKTLIGRYGSLISKIILIRIGKSGAILPIDPCEKCQKLLAKYGIKVSTIKAFDD